MIPVTDIIAAARRAVKDLEVLEAQRQVFMQAFILGALFAQEPSNGKVRRHRRTRQEIEEARAQANNQDHEHSTNRI